MAVVRVCDGRDLAVEITGDPAGTPIFLLHGMPGSRRGPKPRSSVLYRLGVRLICYDRPGYGGSTRSLGRTVADAAQDVRAIADHLEVEKFGVVGRSGGGPHALACAAMLDGRVVAAAVLVSLAPSDARDLDWYDGMAQSNVDDFGRTDDDPSASEAELEELADRIRDNPEALLENLNRDLATPDHRVVHDVAIRGLLTDTYAEALRESACGWIDDRRALRRPWGFDLSSIKTPVLLWHGGQDRFSPVKHTYWLAQRISTAVVKVESDAAHFGALEILPSVLVWIKEPTVSEGLRIQRVHQPAFSA